MRHPHQGNRLLGPPLSPSSAVPVLRTYRLERELQQAPSDSWPWSSSSTAPIDRANLAFLKRCPQAQACRRLSTSALHALDMFDVLDAALALLVWRRRRVRLTIPNYSLTSNYGGPPAWTIIRSRATRPRLRRIVVIKATTHAALDTTSNLGECGRRQHDDGGCEKPSRKDGDAIRAHLSLRKGGYIRLSSYRPPSTKKKGCRRAHGSLLVQIPPDPWGSEDGDGVRRLRHIFCLWKKQFRVDAS